MSIHKEVTLICNHCYSTYSVVATTSFRYARRLAEADGWVREGKLDFCSPEHREEYRNKATVFLTIPQTYQIKGADNER